MAYRFRSLSSDTGRGLGESPEGDPAHAPDLHLHERTSTQRRPPITRRKKCDGHTPHPAPDPGPFQGRALTHVLGLDPGRDASQEDARKRLLPTVTLIQLDQSRSFVKKSLF